ncbi:HAUS augmin-like complex subunit 4 [Latimeria chalumnae]|uniref:HAUS augmin like complex subunit 4 n=1 Tax=Latimeria chalumnae TaxID=7897 RepID=H3AY14_LATCH|nr:PREDICTED: HAUS augmin-like complex subunit 4 [Latimeria chalumnae]XP_014344474.1 PREDICTED: HAUS augmin-like complex subunit 4 [Latimeria chalumnae]|eukprot:XP_005997088.1 PREDICTED: HAUS augmin-like complex subunit 4 [Latimeria chalumnae]
MFAYSGFGDGNSSELPEHKEPSCLCQPSEDDLSQHPGFADLLLRLRQHVDETGLSTSLRKELEQADRELKLQRVGWLRSELLHRLIQELLQEYHAQKWETPPEDATFYETLEQCLLVAECTKSLDPSKTTTQDAPPLLGLEIQHLMSLAPESESIRQMKEQLPGELEQRLKRKCFSVLSYYKPECEADSRELKTAKSCQLAELLEEENRRLQAEREGIRAQARLLQEQRVIYLAILTRCLGLLQRLLMDFRLKTQSDLDRKTVEYLEVKCNTILLQIRTGELEILLETYTAERVSAHRTIRATLEEKIQKEEQAMATSRRLLHSYEVLGAEFESLVQEYTHLKEEIVNKKWALHEFTKSNQ